MTHKIRGVLVEEYAYCVNKFRENVGLETWIWRQLVRSQTAHTKYKWPPYANEWTPHENFLRKPLFIPYIIGKSALKPIQIQSITKLDSKLCMVKITQKLLVLFYGQP